MSDEKYIQKAVEDPLSSAAINSALFRITEQVHSTNDLGRFFSNIHEIINSFTYAENFYIALYDQNNETISFPYIVDKVSQLDIDALADLSIEILHNTLTGYMLRTGEMLHADAAKMQELTSSGEINKVGDYSHEWLGFPLKKGNKILGALVVQSYDKSISYNKQDVDLLTFVSQHVATALVRKQSDDALKESEKKLREVLENSRVISYKFNLSLNQYDYVSSNINSIFGFTSEEYLALTFDDAKNKIHPDDRDLYREHFKNILTHSKFDADYVVPIVEYRWLYKDGDYRWFSDTRTVLYDNDGHLNSIIGSVRDIHDLKESERKLRETEDELHRIQELENIGVLAGGLAHDFNNILTGLFGNISLAKMTLSSAHPGFKYLDRSEKSMERATSLTRQLLTFSSGGVPIKEAVVITELIEQTALFDLSGSNVKPIFNFAENLSEAMVDKGQLQQVISNLVINANQAMPDGGKLTIKVDSITLSKNELATLKQGEYIKIEIQDVGVGIDDAMLDRIFDPYFSTKTKGSGLGLTTVFSIVTKHNGYISVDSEKGKGSLFTIYLPLAKAKVMKKKISEEKTSLLKSNNKVLIMDDDEDILSLVSTVLEIEGYEITTALDGVEMLDKYQSVLSESEPFDAVIMDLTIPGGMGGKEAMIELLKIDANAKCIVSSGYADDPIMANFKDYGFKASIPKPFPIKELHTTLLEIIEG